MDRTENRRRFAPLSADHPLVQSGDPCPICAMPFSPGDVVELIPLGPDLANREAVAKARDGRAYNARAVAVHTACRPPAEEF